MAFLIPLIVGGVSGFGFSNIFKRDNSPRSPQDTMNGVDITKLAGYAIAGGLAFYFGKKLIK